METAFGDHCLTIITNDIKNSSQENWGGGVGGKTENHSSNDASLSEACCLCKADSGQVKAFIRAHQCHDQGQTPQLGE